MERFHILVISISITIFIGLFIYTAYVFYGNKSTLFPPDLTNCPDNWILQKDGRCKIPQKGQKNLGKLEGKGRPIYSYDIKKNKSYSFLPEYNDTPNGKTQFGKPETSLAQGYYNFDIPYGYDEENPQIDSIDFTDSGWATYGDPYCEIRKWARQNNIQWDGMMAYNKCS